MVSAAPGHTHKGTSIESGKIPGVILHPRVVEFAPVRLTPFEFAAGWFMHAEGGPLSTTAAQSPAGAHAARRAPRFPAAIPVDVTVLRSGIPYTIPGRATNFGEFGMGAMLAGELSPGDVIGVAFRVPEIETPIRTRALVRHQAKLQCGLSFVGLLPEQQMIIERWSRRMAGARPPSRSEDVGTSPENAAPLALPEKGQRSRIILLVLAIVLVTGGLGWWHWNQAWQALESRVQEKVSSSSRPRPRPRVAPEVMEQLLIHKVDPVLPETGGGPAPGQDAVVLRAVVGTDGTVMSVRPLSGPPALLSAATDAVKWWKYQPYLIDGQPVEVETTVRVSFPGTNPRD
jgi:Gram-negative bacterial TonB protein C-terminal